MRQLLWKDYRLNRPVLILCAAILATIYLIGAGVEISSTWPEMPTAKGWAGMLVSYGSAALFLTSPIAALLGGNAIACERADRSAHFLAYLPPTKGRILASKFIVAACATAVVWGWILLSAYVIASWLTSEPADFLGTFTVAGAAAMCVLAFGVGWLGSAFMEKAIIPIIAAMVSPWALGFMLMLIGSVCGIPRFEVLEWASPASLGVGVTAFALGTWIYCRRIEP